MRAAIKNVEADEPDRANHVANYSPRTDICLNILLCLDKRYEIMGSLISSPNKICIPAAQG